ncbi:unnamed protein product [Effrenium voratum]|uniref:Uncharacterized protein n=1 Tax=Effrenium voratum TaxID=2562239 RepID=A0AA36JB89_9DINO|nr:unnamed protein product [Effrenium voratum]
MGCATCGSKTNRFSTMSPGNGQSLSKGIHVLLLSSCFPVLSLLYSILFQALKENMPRQANSSTQKTGAWHLRVPVEGDIAHPPQTNFSIAKQTNVASKHGSFTFRNRDPPARNSSWGAAERRIFRTTFLPQDMWQWAERTSRREGQQVVGLDEPGAQEKLPVAMSC